MVRHKIYVNILLNIKFFMEVELRIKRKFKFLYTHEIILDLFKFLNNDSLI